MQRGAESALKRIEAQRRWKAQRSAEKRREAKRSAEKRREAPQSREAQKRREAQRSAEAKAFGSIVLRRESVQLSMRALTPLPSRARGDGGPMLKRVMLWTALLVYKKRRLGCGSHLPPHRHHLWVGYQLRTSALYPDQISDPTYVRNQLAIRDVANSRSPVVRQFMFWIQA